MYFWVVKCVVKHRGHERSECEAPEERNSQVAYISRARKEVATIKVQPPS